MKKWIIMALLAASLLLVRTQRALAKADCDDQWASVPGNHANIALTYQAVTGGDSAKFNEYRDITPGLTGEAGISQSDKNSFVRFSATEIGRTDYCYNLGVGEYGLFSATLYSNEIPHNYAFGALSLYSGQGTNDLSLPPGAQSFLQASGSSNILAARLMSILPLGNSIDFQVFRKTYGASFQFTPTSDLTVNAGFSWENRTGTKPIFGSFGFSNAVELAQPIDYDTFDRSVGAEYSKNSLYLKANYGMSTFSNANDDLIWANPFRAVDSTSPFAFVSTNGSGSSQGLISLDPNNRFEDLSTTGAWRNLPGHGTLAVTSSWSWAQDNDLLLPYTINSAIVPGAAGSPPFDASSFSSLLEPSVNENVSTTLLNAYYTATPVNFIHVTGRFREYDYRNDTPITTFPGFVLADAVWQAGDISTVPTGFRNITDTFEVGFDLLPQTTLTLHYDNNTMDRTENREAPHLVEDNYQASLDSQPESWVDAHLSYQHARRGGLYYPYGPGGIVDTSVFPYIVEFNEGDRELDGTTALVNFFPTDAFTLSATLSNQRDIYFNSLFGLLNDARNSFSLDGDFDVTERLDLNASWDQEAYLNNQAARQWFPGGVGDPYLFPGVNNPSNWTAESLDHVTTIEGGFKLKFDPHHATFQTHYSLSHEVGSIHFSSPLGTPANDANPFVPLDFPNVDSSDLHTLDSHFTYIFPNEHTLTIGWMWQRLDINDLNYPGFTYVPVSLTGAYKGLLLMGTLPQNYNINVFYSTYSFHF